MIIVKSISFLLIFLEHIINSYFNKILEVNHYDVRDIIFSSVLRHNNRIVIFIVNQYVSITKTNGIFSVTLRMLRIGE